MDGPVHPNPSGFRPCSGSIGQALAGLAAVSWVRLSKPGHTPRKSLRYFAPLAFRKGLVVITNWSRYRIGYAAGIRSEAFVRLGAAG